MVKSKKMHHREIIDLHTHTTHSDGELTPPELLAYAAEKKLAAIAITDHDTVSAYTDELFTDAKKKEIDLIPGVEISAIDEDNYRFHVLGLFINPASEDLKTALSELNKSRETYTQRVVEKLTEHGWHVALQVEEGQTVTKAHIADAVIADPANIEKLVRRFGYPPNRGEFIEAIMNAGQECYVVRKTAHPKEALEMIREAGGLGFIAHPVAMLYEQDIPLPELTEKIKAFGFDGIEAIYYYYNNSDGDREIDAIDTFTKLADTLGLPVVGGSDFHGISKKIGAFTDLGLAGKRIIPTRHLLEILKHPPQSSV